MVCDAIIASGQSGRWVDLDRPKPAKASKAKAVKAKAAKVVVVAEPAKTSKK